MAITIINRAKANGRPLTWRVIAATTPQEAVEHYMRVSGRNVPSAWLEGNHSGRLPSELLTLATAQGQLIDLVDGKYVPRGTDHSHEPTTTEGGTFHPGNVDKALHDLLTTVPITDNDKRNAAMLARDKPDNKREPKPQDTPFDRFKGFVVERSAGMFAQTSGREFGRFVLPDSIGSLSKVTGR